MTDEDIIQKAKEEIELHHQSAILSLMTVNNFHDANINKAYSIAHKLCEDNKYKITGGHHPNDVFVIKNPLYKPATFAEKHPYRHAAIIALIGAIVGAGISVPISQMEQRSNNQEQRQLDSLQNERFQRLSDSIKMLQKH